MMEAVIDLTKSPPDPAPAPAPTLQNMEVTPRAPIIRPRVLFPVEASLALHPIIPIQVKIFCLLVQLLILFLSVSEAGDLQCGEARQQQPTHLISGCHR